MISSGLLATWQVQLCDDCRSKRFNKCNLKGANSAQLMAVKDLRMSVVIAIATLVDASVHVSSSAQPFCRYVVSNQNAINSVSSKCMISGIGVGVVCVQVSVN